MTKIPTLIHTRTTAINPEVCDVNRGAVRVRFPDGSVQPITGIYEDDPERVRGVLFDWLEQHMNAVSQEYEESGCLLKALETRYESEGAADGLS